MDVDPMDQGAMVRIINLGRYDSDGFKPSWGTPGPAPLQWNSSSLDS